MLDCCIPCLKVQRLALLLFTTAILNSYMCSEKSHFACLLNKCPRVGSFYFCIYLNYKEDNILNKSCKV